MDLVKNYLPIEVLGVHSDEDYHCTDPTKHSLPTEVPAKLI
jgi:hypothetical protein